MRFDINKHKRIEPRRRFESTRVITVGFALMILVGAILLCLPFCGGLPFMDALFTAASAVCVTGLSVVDVSARLTRPGQVVLLLLIQIGGLGFMVFGLGILRLMGRRMSLRERMLFVESMNSDQMGGVSRMIVWVLAASLIVECAGAALLLTRFVPMLGWGEGLFFALFHSVSAFCNAGFDLFGTSLLGFASDPVVLFTLMLLIVSGGLGFAVLLDIFNRGGLMTHTRLVLVSTCALLGAGFILTLALEWNGALSPMPWPHKLTNALFQSVTLRTAGFATFDQASLRPVTKLMCCLFMFIGAAPASTGGGVKVTTFAVVALLVTSAARGESEPVVGRKRLENSLLLRAVTVFLVGLCVAFGVSAWLIYLEPSMPPLDLIYEAFSAFGTAGLSCGVTPLLGPASRAALIFAMFLGRVGPLTLTLAIARRQRRHTGLVTYSPAKIMIG